MEFSLSFKSKLLKNFKNTFLSFSSAPTANNLKKIEKWLLVICSMAIAALAIISFTSTSPSWKTYKRRALRYQKRIPGWCCTEKASHIMDLIYETHPEVCVEIGVFSGASAYPAAAALAYLKKGRLYAIDPWNIEECTKGYLEIDENVRWWRESNLEHALKKFNRILSIKRLFPFCRIMRMTSYQASAYFKDESIDILHIDGNHSENMSFADVKMYLPKVKKGGYIWFDDANWNSTKKSVHYLMQFCSLDVNKSIDNSCCLFRKNNK